MITEILIFILISLLSFYFYAYKRVHYYYKKRGIKFLSGVPILGNFLGSTLLIKHFWEDVDMVYKAFPDEKYVGISDGVYPIILVRDPELIKSITVKDFEYFQKHQPFVPIADPLFGSSLFTMYGEVWKDMRAVLTSSFSGSKLKQVMPYMMEVCTNLVENIRDHQHEDVDLDVALRQFTNDVFARAALGIATNTFKSNNDLYKFGKIVMTFNFWQRIQLLILTQFPGITKLMRVHVWGTKTTNFFRNLYKNNVGYRIANRITRPDVVQALMETTKEFTLDQLAGQIFFNYMSAFDSIAGICAMGLIELTINPHVQEIMYEEIKNFNEKYDCLTFDKLRELTYLNCVINEILRKWPAALILDRVCTKNYELPPPREGKPLKVYPGDIIYSAVNSLHWDPKYFSEPEKFRPERFLEGNKCNIKPYTYMPFGLGPRYCVGKRYVLLTMQVLLYSLVSNYKIVGCGKTVSCLQLKPYDLNIRTKGGCWVRFEERH